ncbi:MAG: hypothetical protein U5J83_19220 [Bryobacterales bacterium]|nr:hypothetical protein [Bryobacterales bacterium]
MEAPEGNELHVLRGLAENARNRIDVVQLEVTPKWIAELGGTAEQLFSLMKDSGFMPFEAELHWLFKIFSPQLRFSPLEAPKPEQHDVLFVRPHLTPL